MVHGVKFLWTTRLYGSSKTNGPTLIGPTVIANCTVLFFVDVYDDYSDYVGYNNYRDCPGCKDCTNPAESTEKPNLHFYTEIEAALSKTQSAFFYRNSICIFTHEKRPNQLHAGTV